MGQIDQLRQWVNESDNIVFFGGAGVSTPGFSECGRSL